MQQKSAIFIESSCNSMRIMHPEETQVTGTTGTKTTTAVENMNLMNIMRAEVESDGTEKTTIDEDREVEAGATMAGVNLTITNVNLIINFWVHRWKLIQTIIHKDHTNIKRIV